VENKSVSRKDKEKPGRSGAPSDENGVNADGPSKDTAEDLYQTSSDDESYVPSQESDSSACSTSGSEMDSDSDSEANSDKGSDKGSDEGSEEGSEEGSDEGSEEGSDEGSDIEISTIASVLKQFIQNNKRSSSGPRVGQRCGTDPANDRCNSESSDRWGTRRRSLRIRDNLPISSDSASNLLHPTGPRSASVDPPPFVPQNLDELVRLCQQAKSRSTELARAAVTSSQSISSQSTSSNSSGDQSSSGPLDNLEAFEAFQDSAKLPALIPHLQELQAMVGLRKIKQQVLDLVLHRVQTGLPKAYLGHVIIHGGPGVGKTTFANILAKVLHALGDLKKSKVVHASAQNMIAEYLGQTTNKTKNLIESAFGGVLLLDEASSLSDGRSNGSGDSFSKSAIDTLNRMLTEHESKFVCIIAGYKDEIKRDFMDVNPGLARRFTSVFEMEPYRPAELQQIAERRLLEKGFRGPEKKESAAAEGRTPPAKQEKLPSSAKGWRRRSSRLAVPNQPETLPASASCSSTDQEPTGTQPPNNSGVNAGCSDENTGELQLPKVHVPLRFFETSRALHRDAEPNLFQNCAGDVNVLVDKIFLAQSRAVFGQRVKLVLQPETVEEGFRLFKEHKEAISGSARNKLSRELLYSMYT